MPCPRYSGWVKTMFKSNQKQSSGPKTQKEYVETRADRKFGERHVQTCGLLAPFFRGSSICWRTWFANSLVLPSGYQLASYKNTERRNKPKSSRTLFVFDLERQRTSSAWS